MEAKKYAYAAIGAPVAIAKQAQEKIDDVRGRATDAALEFSKDARDRMTAWSKEGEKLVGKVTDSKRIDDLTARVDFEQAKEQVNKLRDQLEDLLSTWKANFRPETKPVGKETVVIEAPAKSTAAKSTPAKSTPAKSTAAKSTTAKSTTAKSTTAKKPAGKTTAKPAAKKPAGKTTTGKTSPKAGAAKSTAAKRPAAKTPATAGAAKAS